MDEYNSEKEQLEAIRKWWDENGRFIIVGLAIGMAAVGGWRWWVHHRNARSEAASMLYAQMQLAQSADDKGTAERAAREIIGKYSDTGYAADAAFALARTEMSAGHPNDAVAQLQWILGNVKDNGLKLLARMRLARIKLASGEPKAALELLNKVKDAGGFEPLYQVLKGDIELALGNKDGARNAYELALANSKPGVVDPQMLQIKIDALGKPSHPSGQQAAPGVKNAQKPENKLTGQHS